MTVAAVKSFINRPDTILFIGSGISRWSGLPGWRELIESLADFVEENGQDGTLVRREAESADLLQAASYGFSKLTPTAIGQFIRNAVRLGSARPAEIHRIITALGPTSYITTNYDNLLEQALAEWKSDTFFPSPVTNRHLSEIADLLNSRSSHFIFKPHGDAGDSASIILTREQYRLLLPGGERHRVLEALKTLMLTRPILYLGFSLRDPDFMYIRDLLLNTFQGAVREHWAILPDITPDESTYWRDQYGVNLLGYVTETEANGSQNHDNLIHILKCLAGPTGDLDVAISGTETGKNRAAERLLALTRYAARVLRLKSDSAVIGIKIARAKGKARRQIRRDSYANWEAVKFLVDGPERALLTGLPGSGKSFCARTAAATLAQSLQEICLDEGVEFRQATIPIYIDLKLFDGSLEALITSQTPAGFSLQELQGDMSIRLFLDAYNEMPAQHREEDSLFKQIDTLRATLGDLSYIITSRTTDGLNQDNLPAYELAWLEQNYVDRALEEKGISLSGGFGDETRRLFCRPFFLNLLITGRVNVSTGGRPRDVFSSYVASMQADFTKTFGAGMALSAALSKVAFRAIDENREAFPNTWILDALDEMNMYPSSASHDVVNWLISRDFLVSYSGARASFAHQSITEYLASLEFVERVNAGALSLKATSALKRWDQCLFMALGLMAPAKAAQVLELLVRADAAVAFNAVRYAEDRQSEAISDLLRYVAEAPDVHNRLMGFVRLKGIPFGLEHRSALEELLNRGGSLAGEAVSALADLLGAQYKTSLITLMDIHRNDYNFSTNGIAKGLAPLLNPEDLPTILGLYKDPGNEDPDNDDERRNYGLAHLLSAFGPREILAVAEAEFDGAIPDPLLRIVFSALGESDHSDALVVLGEMVGAGHASAVSSFYFALRRRADDQGISDLKFGPDDLRTMWGMRDTAHFWSHAVRLLCRLRPDFKQDVEALIKDSAGLEKIAGLYCIDADQGEILNELKCLIGKSNSDLEKEPFHIFSLSELSWEESDVFVALMLRGNERLTKNLVGPGIPCFMKNFGMLSCGDAERLLEYAMNLDSEKYWERHGIGSVIAQYSSPRARQVVINKMNVGDARLREVIKQCILPYSDDITTDNLSDDALSFLLADIPKPKAFRDFWNNALGHIATEKFAEERLVPLARDASPAALANLRTVLKAAGDRHKRRYLL